MPGNDMVLTGADLRESDVEPPVPAARTQQVGILLVPGFGLMSYAAAIEPLRAANHLSGRKLYSWRNIAPEGGIATASNGAQIVVDHPVSDDVGPLDLLIVCAAGDPTTFQHPPTFRWLRQLGQRGVRIVGVSGGPFVLARAGLLAGYRCTLHWEYAPAFQETFPNLRLTHALYEIDRDRLTCSGGMATFDLMCALIEADHGPRLAAAVGDWFVHTHVRSGSGPQRMTIRERYRTSHPKLLRVLEEMERRIEEPASRESLAALAGVSPRQIERLFVNHLGGTLGEHYLRIRLERANLLLRQTTLPVLEVAMACGFVSASHFSRSYKERFGRAPSAERRPAPQS